MREGGDASNPNEWGKKQEVLRNVLENWKTKTIAQRGRAPPLSLDTPPASCSKRPQLRLMLRGETTAFRIRNGTAHQHPLKTAGLLGYPLSAGPHQSHIPLRCRGDHPILAVSITIRARASVSPRLAKSRIDIKVQVNKHQTSGKGERERGSIRNNADDVDVEVEV